MFAHYVHNILVIIFGIGGTRKTLLQALLVQACIADKIFEEVELSAKRKGMRAPGRLCRGRVNR